MPDPLTIQLIDTQRPIQVVQIFDRVVGLSGASNNGGIVEVRSITNADVGTTGLVTISHSRPGARITVQCLDNGVEFEPDSIAYLPGAVVVNVAGCLPIANVYLIVLRFDI